VEHKDNKHTTQFSKESKFLNSYENLGIARPGLPQPWRHQKSLAAPASKRMRITVAPGRSSRGTCYELMNHQKYSLDQHKWGFNSSKQWHIIHILLSALNIICVFVNIDN